MHRSARGPALWLAALLVVGGLFAWSVHRLDRQIDEAWSSRSLSPSRVYGAALELYPGKRIGLESFVAALRERGYRRTDRSPEAGAFRRRGETVVAHLRDFRYPAPEGTVPGRRLHLRFSSGRIAALREADSGRPVPVARVEPREIALLSGDRLVRKTRVSLESVPVEVIQAVLAVEDQRFFRHVGIDPIRIAGAAWADVRSGRLAQGGSTLTQQLVRTLLLDRGRSFVRKAREIALALRLERKRDKASILEAYLSEIYLGRAGPVGLVGVEEAARHYFSRDVGSLDLAQAALLAGMIRGPNLYDPFRHPEAARDRRATVLRLMAEQGRISEEARRSAASAPLPEPPADRFVNEAPYFVDRVQDELEDRYDPEELRRAGLRVFTTLDERTQRAAREAVADGLEELARRRPELAGGPDRLDAALVVIDPRTGDLRALVGGRSYAASSFNRALRARRQPGSLFKPFVYLAALADTSRGYTLASRVPDTALAIPAGGEEWSPRNYDDVEHGSVTLRRALENSYNLATARLALEVGLSEVTSIAGRAGLQISRDPVPSLALGSFEATPLEMAAAYATLAGGGIRSQPTAVLRVETPAGEEIEGEGLDLRRTLPAEPVHLVHRALQGVVEEGTGRSLRQLGYEGPAAGKTGTTSRYRDAWFVGYTPEAVALVWVGFDRNRSLGLTGAQAALPVWARFARSVPEPFRASFRTPEGVERVRVDSATGALGDPSCGAWTWEYFVEGTGPEAACDGDGWWIF